MISWILELLDVRQRDGIQLGLRNGPKHMKILDIGTTIGVKRLYPAHQLTSHGKVRPA